MAITRTAIVDDDGTLTTGTVVNNAWKQELYNQIDALGSVQSVMTARTDTGAVNNWTAVTTGNGYIPWNGAADATISGLAGGAAGQIVIVENITATKVAYFLHASGLSSAANQFANTATSGATPIAPGGKLAYLHNGTNWRLIFHEQGAWITPTYAGANYTASTGTWTVDAGDVTTQAYYLKGRTLTVTFNLVTTSTSATPTTLNILNTAWGSFTSAKALIGTHVYSDNGAAFAVAYIGASVGGTTLTVNKITGSWAIATNTTSTNGQITFEVQ